MEEKNIKMRDSRKVVSQVLKQSQHDPWILVQINSKSRIRETDHV